MKQISLEKLFVEAGRAVSDLGLAMVDPDRLGVSLVGLSIRPPREEGGEFLLVLRGVDQEGLPLVGFCSASSLEETFRSAVSRLRNGSMKWRADEFSK